jgi:hypothetical protein
MNSVSQIPRDPYIQAAGVPFEPSKANQDEIIEDIVRSLPADAPHKELFQSTLTNVYTSENWKKLHRFNSSLHISTEYRDPDCVIYRYLFLEFFSSMYRFEDVAFEKWKALAEVQRVLVFLYLVSMPRGLDSRFDIILKDSESDIEAHVDQYLSIINELQYLKKILVDYKNLFPCSCVDQSIFFVDFLYDQLYPRFSALCAYKASRCQHEALPTGGPSSASYQMPSARRLLALVSEGDPQPVSRLRIPIPRNLDEKLSPVMNEVVSLAFAAAVQIPPLALVQDSKSEEEHSPYDLQAFSHDLLEGSQALDMGTDFFAVTPESGGRSEQGEVSPFDAWRESIFRERVPSLNATELGLAGGASQENEQGLLEQSLQRNPAPDRDWVLRVYDWVLSFFF